MFGTFLTALPTLKFWGPLTETLSYDSWKEEFSIENVFADGDYTWKKCTRFDVHWQHIRSYMHVWKGRILSSSETHPLNGKLNLVLFPHGLVHCIHHESFRICTRVAPSQLITWYVRSQIANMCPPVVHHSYHRKRGIWSPSIGQIKQKSCKLKWAIEQLYMMTELKRHIKSTENLCFCFCFCRSTWIELYRVLVVSLSSLVSVQIAPAVISKQDIVVPFSF